uniref:Uncharacterized protein n=1 Tax=Octopus bimaculoides TaxID=37653 RepID=A0A0L8GRK8_OCTBM
MLNTGSHILKIFIRKNIAHLISPFAYLLQRSGLTPLQFLRRLFLETGVEIVYSN